MEPLHHDPRTKQQIKDMLYQFLYGPVQQQYQQQLNTIITQNSIACKSGYKAFLYKGVVYSMETVPPPRRLPRLVSSLIPAMDAYLKEVTQLNTQEVPFVVGYITQVLNSSNNFQDYLKVLPSVLHPPLEKMIASCPCRLQVLTEEAIQGLQEKNQKSIELLKKRVMTNLII